jgi:hypothetical protein
MVISKAQLEAANKRGQLAAERGPVAQSARYDSKSRRIVIELGNGCEFAFPVALAEGLAGAPQSKLSRIEITSSGLALHWPLLDADFYVPGLIDGILGSKRWMREIGKLGGQIKSQAKTKAARENGKKGGRPRDRIAA